MELWAWISTIQEALSQLPPIGEKSRWEKQNQVTCQWQGKSHPAPPDGFEAKHAQVVRRASAWYVQLVLQANVEVPEIQPSGHAVGIDVRLNSFVATSDGELIDRP